MLYAIAALAFTSAFTITPLAIAVAKLPVPLPVTSPVSVIVWSPVLAPETEVVPDTASVGVAEPETTTELTEVGAIAPSVSVIAGVVVLVATEPETPFAVVTETEVTVPEPEPVDAMVTDPAPLEIVMPVPAVSVEFTNAEPLPIRSCPLLGTGTRSVIEVTPPPPPPFPRAALRVHASEDREGFSRFPSVLET